MKTKTIEVRAAYTQESVLNHQCDEVRSFETIKEAKSFARYCLTAEYAQAIESSSPMGYAQVIVTTDGNESCEYATAINAKTIVQVRLIRNQNNPNLGVGEIGQFVRASDIAGFSLLRFGRNLWFAKDFDFEVVKAI